MPDLYPVLRYLLFRLEPEQAHRVALGALAWAHSLGLLRRDRNDLSAAVSLMGLRFPNRVGLAAGFDKNGRYIDALGALGFGFIEVGTVTPRAQSGQSRPRLFRLSSARALVNRMGFPNDGAQIVAGRLSQRRFAGVCGVNIGKNAITPLDVAVRDYAQCFRMVAPRADYVAINVSSPNTKDLRTLQEVDRLRAVLEAVLGEREQLLVTHGRRVPVLIKISPDLSMDEIVGIAAVVREMALDGVVAANTTLGRPGVGGMRFAAQDGGLSGAPLAPLALQVIGTLRAALGAGTPIIAAGGIDSATAAQDAVKAGADLVQIYTGLIYRGPRLVTEVREALRHS